MSIYTQRGAEVVFNHPTAGYPDNQELAKEYLKVGATYTVERTRVSGSHTDVYLQEIKGIAFNSVHFDNK